MKKPVLFVLLCLVLPSSLLAREEGMRSGQTRGGHDDSWGYAGERGPEYWGKLSEKFSLCAAGQQQSPVDIQEAIPTELPRLRFSYRSSDLLIRERGNAPWLDYDRKSFLYIDNKPYRLLGIEFHTPGEHGFQGSIPAMEIHLHHSDAEGNRLIIAVPVAVGRHKNTMLLRIEEGLSRAGDLWLYQRPTGINAIFLLPSRRSYFAYTGSMTRPPCEEGVRWIVMKNSITVSKESLEIFRRLTGNNARPMQPLNGREILSDQRG